MHRSCMLYDGNQSTVISQEVLKKILFKKIIAVVWLVVCSFFFCAGQAASQKDNACRICP